MFIFFRGISAQIQISPKSLAVEVSSAVLATSNFTSSFGLLLFAEAKLLNKHEHAGGKHNQEY